jgi:hypothetical protein
MSSMSIFDDRLIPSTAAAGTTPPNLADNTYRVNATINLAEAFLWVKNYANLQPGKKLDKFNILCHGLYNWAESSELQQSALVGGFGLQLCREGLTQTNIDTIAPLVKDKLGDVFIYACGAGSAQADGPVNGVNFCKLLANKLNCVVYAANRMQVFSFYTTVARPLDFGDWEGTVTRYTPDGLTAVVGQFASPNRT